VGTQDVKPVPCCAACYASGILQFGSLPELHAGWERETAQWETLNQFLATRTSPESGLAPDLQTLGACIDALAALGDSSSYASLFATMLTDYPPEVRLRSAEALRLIRGDYKKFLIDVVRKNPPAEKATAFRTGMENAAFSASERGELAEAALDISLGLDPTDPEELSMISELRYAAIRELRLSAYRATPWRENFYRVQTDFGKEPQLKDASWRLSLPGRHVEFRSCPAFPQLGLINADMNGGGRSIRYPAYGDRCLGSWGTSRLRYLCTSVGVPTT
jgi:hypothetical protein